ncbi:MAG: hypothetical protein E4H48_10385 [Syntrophobacterales bacterium]|nr:MAG: hypothetical protein E4H48_10385 [Syntrophobacterales bacterium]
MDQIFYYVKYPAEVVGKSLPEGVVRGEGGRADLSHDAKKRVCGDQPAASLLHFLDQGAEIVDAENLVDGVKVSRAKKYNIGCFPVYNGQYFLHRPVLEHSESLLLPVAAVQSGGRRHEHVERTA